MKYALTSFALIITLIGGFIFGAYYMYNKYNPKAETAVVSDAGSEESEELDNSGYYDEDGNWKFKYGTDESGYEGEGESVSTGAKAAENIDYRITGTNFVYEDDGSYSGFHAVVTIENIGASNLYLGRDSVFDIEDRSLNVVDSYDYVRAVPDVIAPGEKGYFYVPYGQIKTKEDSVTIEEDDLSGDILDPTDANTLEGNINEDENNAIDIEDIEDALKEMEETSASIKVDLPVLLAAADESSSDAATEKSDAATDKSSDTSSDNSGDAKTDDSAADSSSSEEKTEDGAAENASGTVESAMEAGESTSEDITEEGENSETDENSEEGENTESSQDGATMEPVEEPVEYPGLSLYRVHEYFILPNLDVQKCADDPRSDFDITNIVYGSNTAGYFTLTGDVLNKTEENIDYVPVTVVALDRRGNAIAVGKDSLNDFYSGSKKNFGVSYVLTREERSNIVQCVIYAREVVSK